MPRPTRLRVRRAETHGAPSWCRWPTSKAMPASPWALPAVPSPRRRRPRLRAAPPPALHAPRETMLTANCARRHADRPTRAVPPCSSGGTGPSPPPAPTSTQPQPCMLACNAIYNLRGAHGHQRVSHARNAPAHLPRWPPVCLQPTEHVSGRPPTMPLARTRHASCPPRMLHEHRARAMLTPPPARWSG